MHKVVQTFMRERIARVPLVILGGNFLQQIQYKTHLSLHYFDMKALTKQNIYAVSVNLFSKAGFKTVVSSLFPVYAFLFDPLKTHLYYAIATLIVFDFITAMFAAYHTKEKITSAKASRTLVKMLVYGLMISGATLTDRFIVGNIELFADLSMGFVAITEFISILENISKLGFEVPSNVVKRLNYLKKQEILTKVDEVHDKLHTTVDKEMNKIKDTL